MGRLSVGTKDGYFIFTCDPFKLSFQKMGESTSILQMLFNTSLVAHVGAGEAVGSSQRCLRMINTRRDKEIIRMNYRTQVRAVLLNRQRLVLVLETTIYIYDISNMKLVHVISSTPKNTAGVCALSSCHIPGQENAPDVNNFLAYPAKDDSGQVYIYDTINLRLMNAIEAHDTPVVSMAFNNRGDRLATASTKGTVFRVWATPSG